MTSFSPAGTTPETPPNTSAADLACVELRPSYRIPIALVGMALPAWLIQPWLALAIAIFGLFLGYQSTAIRLVFTDSELQVLQNRNLIRQFPYQTWQNWAIFWRPIPILFYFREVKSIHFLPMLFRASELLEQLERRVGALNPEEN
jgi:Protein of unknown function (DUF3119)